LRAKLFAVVGLTAALGVAQAHAAPAEEAGNAEFCRAYVLRGYGLVAGLSDTGDTLADVPFTRQAMQAFLLRTGNGSIDPVAYDRTVASVMVTANIKFCREPDGSTNTPEHWFDIRVGALGNAKSIQGGTLLRMIFYGDDGKPYATGQGHLTPCPVEPHDRNYPNLNNPNLQGCIVDGGFALR
jgi:flagellar P-ring protein FlgI